MFSLKETWDHRPVHVHVVNLQEDFVSENMQMLMIQQDIRTVMNIKIAAHTYCDVHTRQDTEIKTNSSACFCQRE